MTPALTKQMARAHVDLWADEKRRADDAEAALRHLLSIAGPVDEETGFCTIRATPEFLKHISDRIEKKD